MIISLALLTSAHAGPCTSEIEAVEKAINAANSPYAPMAPQSVGAQLGHQPTPSSVARAEGQADAGYQAALDRARALDNERNPQCAMRSNSSKSSWGCSKTAHQNPDSLIQAGLCDFEAALAP
jgi:hypothetical protein